MRSQNKWTGIVVGIVMGVLFSAAGLLAGSLEPSLGPTQAGSQMYTLDHIYNRINNGAAATKMNTFTEPSSGPTSATMHTLDEIYNLVGFRAPVARTGQTSTLNPAPAGSDGELQKGVAWPIPRFTNNNNGTVTDNLTGLIWLRDGNCTNFFSGDNTGQNNRPWPDALIAANSLASGKCDLTDGSTTGQWRLPNVREMQSLIDYGYGIVAIPPGHPFTGFLSHICWSSSTLFGYSESAWSVNLSVGSVDIGHITTPYYVWPVRGGQ